MVSHLKFNFLQKRNSAAAINSVVKELKSKIRVNQCKDDNASELFSPTESFGLSDILTPSNHKKHSHVFEYTHGIGQETDVTNQLTSRSSSNNKENQDYFTSIMQKLQKPSQSGSDKLIKRKFVSSKNSVNYTNDMSILFSAGLGCSKQKISNSGLILTARSGCSRVSVKSKCPEEIYNGNNSKSQKKNEFYTTKVKTSSLNSLDQVFAGVKSVVRVAEKKNSSIVKPLPLGDRTASYQNNSSLVNCPYSKRRNTVFGKAYKGTSTVKAKGKKVKQEAAASNLKYLSRRKCNKQRITAIGCQEIIRYS